MPTWFATQRKKENRTRGNFPLCLTQKQACRWPRLNWYFLPLPAASVWQDLLHLAWDYRNFLSLLSASVRQDLLQLAWDYREARYGTRLDSFDLFRSLCWTPKAQKVHHWTTLFQSGAIRRYQGCSGGERCSVNFTQLLHGLSNVISPVSVLANRPCMRIFHVTALKLSGIDDGKIIWIQFIIFWGKINSIYFRWLGWLCTYPVCRCLDLSCCNAINFESDWARKVHSHKTLPCVYFTHFVSWPWWYA